MWAHSQRPQDLVQRTVSKAGVKTPKGWKEHVNLENTEQLFEGDTKL